MVKGMREWFREWLGIEPPTKMKPRVNLEVDVYANGNRVPGVVKSGFTWVEHPAGFAPASPALQAGA